MTKILFSKTYDSESMVDMGRDVFEAFDERFNENAVHLTDDKSLLTRFCYKNEHGEQELLKRQYDADTYNEVEGDLYDSLDNLTVEQDEHGFFDGDLIVEMIIQ